MPSLPVPFDEGSGWLTSRQAIKAQRARANAELTIYRHGLRAEALKEMDEMDSEALAYVTRTALNLELDLLEHGMSRAGQSAAKLVLVSRHVDRLSAINNQRITRRFG